MRCRPKDDCVVRDQVKADQGLGGALLKKPPAPSPPHRCEGEEERPGSFRVLPIANLVPRAPRSSASTPDPETQDPGRVSAARGR